VPKNEALIRQFGVFKTRAEAAAREQALIAQYGRKGLDPGGTLLNRTLGGDRGALGYSTILTPEQRAKHDMAQTAKKRLTAGKYGINPEQYLALTPKQRRTVRNRYHNGVRGNLLLESIADGVVDPRIMAAAQKYETTYEQWESLTLVERKRVAARYARGIRGAELMADAESKVNPLLIRGAKANGVSLEDWVRLTPKGRATLRARYRRGIRGAALLEGLI
jgi:hypothetical protein